MRLLAPRFHQALPVLLTALYAGPAMAQGPAAAPAYGPALPGVCLFSQSQVVARSKAGTMANQQLEALAKSTQSDLEGQRSAILNDGRALAGSKGKATAADYDQRQKALQQRAKSFDELATTRTGQLQRTRQEVSGEIGRALGPILNGLISQHHCSLVLDKGATYGGNPAMDLSDSAVQQLDARLPSLRVSLAAPPASASPR